MSILLSVAVAQENDGYTCYLHCDLLVLVPFTTHDLAAFWVIHEALKVLEHQRAFFFSSFFPLP